MDEPSTKEEEEIISQLEEATQLMEEGQYFKAILLLQKLIAKHPSHWQAYNQMALAYFYSNQVEPALETLFEVLEKNEGNIQALCHLAIIYHYTGQVDESKKLIGMLENVHPIHEEQRLKLGITMNILQQYKLGFQWLYSLYRKGLEGTDMFYYWLTVSAVQLGKGHIAEKVWKRGLEVGDQERLQTLPDPFGPPQDPVLSKENIQQHGFDFSKALSHFQELKDSPSFRSALVHKLYESTLQEKFQILYVLSKLKDIEAEKTLEIYVDSKQEPILSRQFANAILLKEMEVDQHVQRSYELLLELESDQIVLDEPTFDTWYTLISNAEIKNIIAWKSAILYFILKEKSDQVTQQSVSDRCGVSVATLQKYNKKLKHILTLEENNKK
jgi:tetratricopeptide (TPR) repeat protein